MRSNCECDVYAAGACGRCAFSHANVGITNNSMSANDLKNEGNEHLKHHRYNEAIEAYTKAIALDLQNAIFFCNRAQVHIKLENYGLAIGDCDAAIAVDPAFMKAYYRKGVALMALLNYKEAQNNFKTVLAKLPNDRLTLENYKQCVNYLKKQAFERAIASTDKLLVIEQLDFDGMLVEKSWEGPALDIKKEKDQVLVSGLDSSYLKYMIEHFKNGGKLPKKHVFAIIAVVHQLLKQENVMVEVSIPHSQLEQENTINGAKKITVVGDTHGQFYDVLNLFAKFGHVADDHVYLFNGDFVDRGLWSCEVALYLYVLKAMFPKNVYINRGNHETNDMNKTYGFTDECEAKYSKKVFEAFAESFGALPLATLINDSYLVMHGGLFSSDEVTLDDIRKINRFPASGSSQPSREGLAMELLWTDPQPENGRSMSKRGLGIQFGPDVTEKFCVKNKIRKVLRSHEVRMGGVEVEHNGRLITVFSAPDYCDATGNLGGVVHITENSGYDKSSDKGEGYLEAEEKNCPWKLDIETFSAVPHPDIKPMAYSKSGFGF